MLPDPIEERRRLTEHYRATSEEELLELARDFNDLTQVAQESLREELRVRGLAAPGRANGASAENVALNRPAEMHFESPPRWRGSGTEEDGEEAGSVEYTWKVTLAECETLQKAWQLGQMLRRAGVDSWVDRQTMRVEVAADQLEQARAAATQPVPQEILDDLNTETPQFESPVCPACGAKDPVLEDVEPVNRWSCEACGREWTDEESQAG